MKPLVCRRQRAAAEIVQKNHVPIKEIVVTS